MRGSSPAVALFGSRWTGKPSAVATVDRQTAGPSDDLDDEIGSIVDRLARFERVAGGAGERAAAELVASELGRRGAQVRLEPARVHGTYWEPIGLASAVAAASALLGRRGATLGGALAAACVIDELEIGRRPLRRLLRRCTATNVVAEITPAGAGQGDPRRSGPTLVIHAHHDAAHTGLVFHPGVAKLAARLAGPLIERIGGTPAPMWGAAAGPLLVSLGAAVPRLARLRGVGAALSAGYAAAMLNIASSPAVPGANDNLSGVAVLLHVAGALARDPCRRLRVLLLSTGSEESFLEAMEAFGAHHFPELPRESTTFLCIESVGSPELMLLSGEGMLRLHRYPVPQLRQLERLAQSTGIPLHDPFRYRLATDGQVPLRASYPTAVISSIDWYKAPSNYHWPSDRPRNLCYGTIARAAQLATALARELDRPLTPSSPARHGSSELPDRDRPAP